MRKFTQPKNKLQLDVHNVGTNIVCMVRALGERVGYFIATKRSYNVHFFYVVVWHAFLPRGRVFLFLKTFLALLSFCREGVS